MNQAHLHGEWGSGPVARRVHVCWLITRPTGTAHPPLHPAHGAQVRLLPTCNTMATNNTVGGVKGCRPGRQALGVSVGAPTRDLAPCRVVCAVLGRCWRARRQAVRQWSVQAGSEARQTKAGRPWRCRHTPDTVPETISPGVKPWPPFGAARWAAISACGQSSRAARFRCSSARPHPPGAAGDVYVHALHNWVNRRHRSLRLPVPA